MYIKTLSVLTAAFLFLLMAIMIGTAPQTLAFNTESQHLKDNKSHHFVNCEEPFSGTQKLTRNI